MGEVLKFTGETHADIPVADVLTGAAELDEVLVLGWTKDGEFYAAGSMGDGPRLLWLVEKFKAMVLAERIGE